MKNNSLVSKCTYQYLCKYQIFGLGLLVFTFLASSIGYSFTLNSSTNPNLKGWSDSNVQLLVNTSNCPAGIDVPGIIAEAVEVWNNVPTSSITVSYGGTTTSTTISGPTTVYCETNFQALLGADQNYVPGAAAADGSSGAISKGILYLNASAGQANIANYNRNDLKIILAHEIGHILGLGHSASINSLMYFDASARKTLSLSQDDMDGISYLYPGDEIRNTNKIAGCGVIGKAFGGRSENGSDGSGPDGNGRGDGTGRRGTGGSGYGSSGTAGMLVLLILLPALTALRLRMRFRYSPELRL